MKIGFVVNHPTQFEVPFYQYVALHHPRHLFKVFYLKEDNNGHYDKELGQNIKWGFNLYADYPYSFLGKEPLKAFDIELQNENFDLIIINGYKNQYSGYAAICKQKNITVALKLDTVLFNQPLWKIWLRKLFLKKEYAVFDYFFVTGKVSKDYLLEMGISPERIGIFSYCTDNEFFKKENVSKNQELSALYKQHNERIILSVAKFMERESPWDILKAFTKLNQKDLSLVLIGDGVEKEALQKYASKFLDLNIHFPGYIKYTDLPAYYQISDIFIHAAKDEPWGVSVQEAIGGNCFVICSDKVGAARDLIKDGKNGFTYSFGYYDELADKISKALTISSENITQTNKSILSYWNYELMCRNILYYANNK